jgi:hypothetical protein
MGKAYGEGLTADGWMIEANTDISLRSESRHFLFSHDFGADTLNVNARFRATDAAKKKPQSCFRSTPSLNNTITLDDSSTFPWSIYSPSVNVCRQSVFGADRPDAGCRRDGFEIYIPHDNDQQASDGPSVFVVIVNTSDGESTDSLYELL